MAEAQPITEKKNYLFWFVALSHSRVEEYEKHLLKYLDASASYIIAKETARGVHHETKGEHLHIAAEISVTDYNRLHVNIHVEQLKLRRKACTTKGGKQVGRVHNVRDDLKMLSYTVKNNNIIYKNIDLKTIQSYIEESFPKKDDWDNDIIDFLIMNFNSKFSKYELDPLEELEDLIIDFYIKNSKKKASLTRAKVRQLSLRYLMYTSNQTTEVKQAIKRCL